jgi:predicted nuclease of restriction endonuclease-like (RecB) superfamily
MTHAARDAVDSARVVELVEAIKERIRTSRLKAARAVNTELVLMYWQIGRDINQRMAAEGWGTKVVNVIAARLRAEFPGQQGWSLRNLRYMRDFARLWPDEASILQRPVAKLPWGHVTDLIGIKSAVERDWYAAKAAENGWSRAVLQLQIKSDLYGRTGAAPTNFVGQLPPSDSDLAQQMVRDPYVFQHVAPEDKALERDFEQALMNRIQDTLLAFGRGMAFVGRQVRFEVAGDEFFVDLLLFHVEQLRYVVVELKVTKFEPAFTGQLGTYVAMVDDLLRNREVHAPTVGILLCTGRNDEILRYSLGSTAAPMAICRYETLSEEERAGMPQPEALEKLIAAELEQRAAEQQDDAESNAPAVELN